MAGMDNSDYADLSSIFGTEVSHYAALVAFQDASVNKPLSKSPSIQYRSKPCTSNSYDKATMPRDTSPYQANSKTSLITRYVAAS
ncbi:hypothetical protein DPMN_190245 [Dreissena polymorpha]|uniref:Uncharacterized protein n=1 Tax=Dreissena polymorpha TaxID=45954 RepID=A0A9D4DW50_DREPO|nr:hypothetical protein DPMN_189776 [Dreissena polymorpha]KAH3755549.1 hypothetical protein DPMN_190245 [Dreissena polymorpha]